MKKSIFLAIIATLIVSLVSCTKDGPTTVTLSADKVMTAPHGSIVFNFSRPTTARETLLTYEIVSDDDVIVGKYKNELKVPMGYDNARVTFLLKHDCDPGEYNVTFRIKHVPYDWAIGTPSEVTAKIIIPDSHVK